MPKNSLKYLIFTASNVILFSFSLGFGAWLLLARTPNSGKNTRNSKLSKKMSISISAFLTLIGFSCLFSGRPPVTAHDDWVFKREKDQVKIYTKKMPNGLTAVKLTASVRATLSGVVQLFSDVDEYGRWGYKMMDAKLVQRTSVYEQHYYAKFDFPWPLADRDIVLHSLMNQDTETKTVSYDNNAVAGLVAEQKGTVRIKEARTQWKFFAPKHGWMYLEQYVCSDPGCDIPGWATDFAINTGPVETIKGIRNRLQTERYQNAKVAHILE